MLSKRGSVSVDARTNTLLVQDTAENITAIRAMVQKLDVAVKQVLIESRIVIANNDSAPSWARASATPAPPDQRHLHDHLDMEHHHWCQHPAERISTAATPARHPSPLRHSWLPATCLTGST